MIFASARDFPQFAKRWAPRWSRNFGKWALARHFPPTPRWIISGELRQHFRRAQILARAVGSALELEFSFGKALGADEDLPGNADQIGGCEFRACPLVG